MKYEKINGKVVEVSEEIKVDGKLLALQDRLTQLEEERIKTVEEIDNLKALKWDLIVDKIKYIF